MVVGQSDGQQFRHLFSATISTESDTSKLQFPRFIFMLLATCCGSAAEKWEMFLTWFESWVNLKTYLSNFSKFYWPCTAMFYVLVNRPNHGSKRCFACCRRGHGIRTCRFQTKCHRATIHSFIIQNICIFFTWKPGTISRRKNSRKHQHGFRPGRRRQN